MMTSGQELETENTEKKCATEKRATKKGGGEGMGGEAFPFGYLRGGEKKGLHVYLPGPFTRDLEPQR